MIRTPAGMPIMSAIADPKIGEREVLAAMLDVEPGLATSRPGLILITDKGFAGRETEADLATRGITLLRPSRKDEQARHSEPLLKTIRQLIESVNDTLKGQLDPEAHGGRTLRGRRHPHRPVHPGHGRRHLAQQQDRAARHQDRAARHPVTARLRPLTTFGNHSSSAASPCRSRRHV